MTTRQIKDREVKVVALDLPTSHMMLKTEDAFTGRMFDALNGMLLDMLAAIARKDYDDRRRRQAQGIAKAKAEGRYKGRPQSIDVAEIKRLSTEMGAADIAKRLGIARSSVYRLLGEA